MISSISMFELFGWLVLASGLFRMGLWTFLRVLFSYLHRHAPNAQVRCELEERFRGNRELMDRLEGWGIFLTLLGFGMLVIAKLFL